MADALLVRLYPESYPATIPAEKQEKPLGDALHCINNVHYPTLTVYLPDPANATGCGVVICPGGGYSVLAIGHEGTQIAQWLNSLGIAAFMLKYRLPPDYRHPVPMQDAQRAIRLVRANSARWQVKPNRIGILGFSAGGHLASTAATHFDSGDPTSADPIQRCSCRPDFAVLCYPVIAFLKDYCHSFSRSQLIGEALPEGLKLQLSNDLQVTPQTPPTFLFHSQDDGAVDPRNSIDFYLACQASKVPAELHIFPNGGHGYGMGRGNSSESQWPALLQKWLQQQGMLKK